MPPKKASNAGDEVDFLKICFRHYKEPMNKANFDFDTVAKETGVKDAQAAYQRFWTIKKKWGMAGGTGTGKAGGGTPKAATNGQKRTAAGKAKGKKNEEEAVAADGGGEGEGDGTEEGSTGANAGSQSEEEAENAEEESPSKKPKAEEAKD